tara:strand:+ start:103 stop:675 length:573 start_codon:yes stop_codon:yes gene_type:complete
MNFDYFNYKSNNKVKKGSIIFSQPLMNDNHFKRSIILICEHNIDGSYGYKLNDKIDSNDFDFSVDSILSDKLYSGGPVDQNYLNFIHNDETNSGKKMMIYDNIFLGGNYNELKKKLDQKSVLYKFFLGYSGWGKGQLDEEVKNNSWIVINDFNIDVIFKKINESSWSKLLSHDSFKNKIFSNYPPDPNLN